MKARIVIAMVAFILIVAAVLAGFAWKSMPKVVEIYPSNGAADIPATSPIRITFSQGMNANTVQSRIKIEPSIDGNFSWEKDTLIFTPSQPWPGGQRIKINLEGGARSASWLAFAMNAHSWSFTTNQEALAYLWPSYANANLYTLDPLSGQIRQYTSGMDVLDYSVSWDGMLIYFCASNFQGGADLFQIDRTKVENAMGNPYQTQKLLDCGTAQCRNPVVSKDKSYLAYEYIMPSANGDAGLAQIWLLNVASQSAAAIGQDAHETVQPGWSSTGWLAYYDRTSAGYELVNIQSGARIQVPNQTGQPGAWSPGGDSYLAPEITYLQAAGGTETGTSHLMRYTLQDETTLDLSGENNVEDVDADYSPDGRLIAFTRKFLDAANWSFGRQIWVMNADGTDQHAITSEGNYNHYDLTWSRDGRMLSYVLFNQAKLSDPAELWMINADGSNPVQLVIGGYSPEWIP